MELAGKFAAVTGGSRGIGRGIVIALAQAGVDVAFTWRKSPEAAQDVARAVEALGRRCLPFELDVRDGQGASRFAAAVQNELGGCDILVNNAGVTRDRSLLLMTPEEWSTVIDTNLGGAFNVTRAFIGAMLRQRGGRIINITSTSGIHGVAGQTNYSASKAGIIGFTKALAREVARFEITVNAVAPGGTSTDMLAAMPEPQREAMAKQIPLRRFADPGEVAAAVLFLASRQAAYITGHVLAVDGGFAM